MTAFEHWLIEYYVDEESIAAELCAQTLLYQNPQVAEILERTGDKEYTRDTFFKAARILLEKQKEEAV